MNRQESWWGYFYVIEAYWRRLDAKNPQHILTLGEAIFSQI